MTRTRVSIELGTRLTTGIDALRTEVVAELDIRERLAALESRRPA